MGALPSPTKYHSLVFFQGHCCWPRAQLLVPRSVASNEVAFLSLAHADPLFQCWGTGWQPKTDGAALLSACTIARGGHEAHAHSSDNISISTWGFRPSIQRGEQLSLGTPVQLVSAAWFCWKGTSSSASKILFIIPVQLSLQQQGLLFWPASNTEAFCSRTKNLILATVSISAY